MKPEKDYTSIPEIVALISEKTKALASGALDAHELHELTEQCRELYERLVVLRFNAFREMSKEEPAIVEESASEVQEPTTESSVPEPVEASDVPAGSFRIALSDDAGQTSLIDAIEEIQQEITPSAETEPELFTPTEEILESTPEPPADHSKTEEVAPVSEEEAEASSTPKIPSSGIGGTQVDPSTLPQAQRGAGSGTEEGKGTRIEEMVQSLNDRLAVEEESLAEQLGKAPLDKIGGNISLNEKFLLINDVFEGNSDHYEKTITALDQASSRDEALKIAAGFNTDADNSGSQLLRELIARRFSAS